MISASELQKGEYYWLRLDVTNHLTIGQWHGTGFWIAGNDLQFFGNDQGVTIVEHIKKPVEQP